MNILITTTKKQDAFIAESYNDLVKDEYKIEPDQAHSLMTSDFFEEDMLTRGYYTYEISKSESKINRTTTFDITDNMVTFEY